MGPGFVYGQAGVGGVEEKLFTPGLGHYGYGWFIETVAAGEPAAGQTTISHEGGINGFNTFEQRLVDEHDLIVVLNNSDADLGAMAKGIRAILFGQEPEAAKQPLASALGGTIVHKGVDAAIAQYREMKRTNPGAYEMGEGGIG